MLEAINNVMLAFAPLSSVCKQPCPHPLPFPVWNRQTHRHSWRAQLSLAPECIVFPSGPGYGPWGVCSTDGISGMHKAQTLRLRPGPPVWGRRRGAAQPTSAGEWYLLFVTNVVKTADHSPRHLRVLLPWGPMPIAELWPSQALC